VQRPTILALADLATRVILAALALFGATAAAQGPRGMAGLAQVQGGRFIVVADPKDEKLARSLLAAALARDSFPGLPNPSDRVAILVAPDTRSFREWIGPAVPEWGAAVAFPQLQRIIMQGSHAPSSAGDPRTVLRHELAHLALHSALGELAPRWFDEGYASFAAGEQEGEDLIGANVTLAFRGVPGLSGLDSLFFGGGSRARAGYALSSRAVQELASLDPDRGLTLFFGYWKDSGSFDKAVRLAFGVTAEAFQERWRAKSRRRFGALALVTDVTLGAVLLLVALGPFWWGRRDRDRKRLAAMKLAEREQERRERESALQALLDPVSPSPPKSVAHEGDSIRQNDDQIKS